MNVSQVLFACDLDNTLICSHKKSEKKSVCVELLNDKPQSFMFPESIKLLSEIAVKMQFIPITSRSIEQFCRITFPQNCVPRYAVTTNGAILLENGHIDPRWIAESTTLTASWQPEIKKMVNRLSGNAEIKTCRTVDQMYVFAACHDEDQAKKIEGRVIGTTSLTIERTGRKIYFLPPQLTKGLAVQRLVKRMGFKKVFAAGDSPMDASMLNSADVALFPQSLAPYISPKTTHMITFADNRFQQDFLQKIANLYL